MQSITKDQFYDILFDPSIQVAEKRSFKRSTAGGNFRGKKQAVIKLVSPDGILAVREITPEGDVYYKP